MEPVAGARSFLTSAAAYDAFMGRYSRSLAPVFVQTVGVHAGHSALDVGCGPGALTGVLVERLGAESVAAFDPSAPFVSECSARYPGVDVRFGQAESIPFDDDGFDFALAQLVLQFVGDPRRAVRECRRVVRGGGIIAACVWDRDAGMEMLRHFWDAALALGIDVPDEGQTLRFGRAGEMAELFEAASLVDIVETTCVVTSGYSGFDELWSGFLSGIGPPGIFCAALSNDRRDALREELFGVLGAPDGAFALAATARCAYGRTQR